MARLFDGTVVSYDAANAKFVSSAPNYASPFDYGSTTAFSQKVDMSAVSSAQDCGECHVGGGGMQYIPNADMNARIPLRSAANGLDGILDGKITAFNYFVDSYDVDADGDKGEVLQNDYTKTGVAEMDCFICHLDGYDYEGSKAAKRLSMFDASRAIGAGIADTADKFTLTAGGQVPVAAFGTDGYGTGVTYLGTAVVQDAATGEIRLADSVVSKMRATPPSENCEHCHFAVHAVDWKKRGEKWDPNFEVHYGIGCMGCHEREDEDYSQAGKSGYFRDNPGIEGETVEAKLGMCDPAKGGGSAFDALSNTLDNKSHKSCADCHLAPYQAGFTGTYKYYNAPNPAAAHSARGLSDLLLQASGKTDGTPGVSHVDLISCEACHVKKDATITGGAFVDGTGPDEEGRLATHDNEHVEHNMDGGVALYWWGGKLYPGNMLTSLFWRSKNDFFYDGNKDGRKGGMDSLLQTHVAAANAQGAGAFNAANAIMADGVVTAAEVSTSIANIEAALDGLTGQSEPTTGSRAVKLSMVSVPFKITHNVAPATKAWGAGGCTDCHGADRGFYNGTYDLQGKVDIQSWSNVVPFTKVNGGVDKVDSHPNMKDKKGIRSVPLRVAWGQSYLRNPDRSEMIYEASFQTRDTAYKASIVGVPFAFGSATDTAASTAGNIIKIEFTPAAADGATFRTRQIPGSANVTSCTDLMTKLGTYATDFEFTISCDDSTTDPAVPAGQGRLTITADAGTTIRLNPATDVGTLGLADALWMADPIVPTQPAVFAAVDTNGNGTIDGQAEMLAYLDSIGSAVAPSADILHVSANPYTGGNLDAGTYETAVTVLQGATINLVADQPVAMGAPVYSWTCSDNGAPIADGASTTRVFAAAGTYGLTLTVDSGSGNIAQDTVYVKVAAPAGVTASWTDVVDGNNFSGALGVTGLPTHTKVTVYWSDYTATTTDLGSGDHSVPHTFRPLSSRLVDTDSDGIKDTYRYPLTVRAYDGATLVKTLSVKVDIPKP